MIRNFKGHIEVTALLSVWIFPYTGFEKAPDYIFMWERGLPNTGIGLHHPKQLNLCGSFQRKFKPKRLKSEKSTMSRVILCKLGRLGELRKVFDKTTNSIITLNVSDPEEEKNEKVAVLSSVTLLTKHLFLFTNKTGF